MIVWLIPWLCVVSVQLDNISPGETPQRVLRFADQGACADDFVIFLAPGETVLGHTNGKLEFPCARIHALGSCRVSGRAALCHGQARVGCLLE